MIGVRKVFSALIVLFTSAVLVIMMLGDTALTSDSVFFVPAIAGTAIGVYLTLRVPDSRMGPLMTVMAAALVTLGLSNVMVPWALDRGNVALTVAVVHLSDVAWVVQVVTALVLLPLWFPTGRPINSRWAWVGRMAIAAAVFTEVSFLLAENVCAYETPTSDTCVTVPNPWGLKGFSGFEPLFLVSMAMALPAVASTFVRWRRSDDVERQQMKWFFGAAIGLLVSFVIAFADFNQILNEVVFAMGLTGVWVSIAVAVLKYRLYEIDRIISRTVSYAVVIVVLAAVYMGLVTAIGSQFRGPLAVATSTLVVAALFNPLRRRVQRWVDRRFNRSTFDTAQLMDEFAGSLRNQVDAVGVVAGWVEVVEETMQPAAVGVWVKD